MLRVDSWLDVASLENVEEDHSVLFLKKNLMKIFFWKFWKFWIFSRNWKFWLMFFFEINLRSTSPMPLVLRPFLKISLFFFLKILEILNFFMELKILIFFFLKNVEVLNFFKGVENFDWLIFFLENLNFSKELKFLKFFFFFLIWRSWIFSRNWNFFFFEIWRFVHYQKVKMKME